MWEKYDIGLIDVNASCDAYSMLIYSRTNPICGKTVYCHDMWERLKKNPDVTFLCEKAAEKSALPTVPTTVPSIEEEEEEEEEHLDLPDGKQILLSDNYDGRVPQALDFEVRSQILGTNNRTKLPKIIASL